MTGKLISKDGKVFDVDIMDKSVYDVTCPSCSHLRKPHNQKEKCLNVNQQKRTARCNHCGVGFKFVYEHEFRNGAAADQQSVQPSG